MGGKQKVVNPVYTLRVDLIGGPVSDEFLKKNPQVSRTILVRSKFKLQDLHGAIFDAFGRDEEHMYEFQVGGKKPMDKKARTYGLKMERPSFFVTSEQDGTVDKTSIADLGLKTGQTFFYWFDFGDDWWHSITVEKIDETALNGKYPLITERIGANPPQYMFDEEDGDEEDCDVEDDVDEADEK